MAHTTAMIFDADTIRSVVEHMNEDHHDACLCIARAFSPHRTAINAALLSFDSTGLDMRVTESDQATHSVRVVFDRSLTRESQIRGTLVAMTKSARASLNE